MNEKKITHFFTTGDRIPDEDYKKLDNLRQHINELLENSGIDLGLGISTVLEVLEHGCRQIYKDLPTEIEMYEAMRKLISDFVDTKIKLVRQLHESKSHRYKLECTLCGQKNDNGGSLGILVVPSKVIRVETEGCPYCYKGKGDIIHNICFYDKDNNLLGMHTAKNLKEWTIAEAREQMKKL